MSTPLTYSVPLTELNMEIEQTPMLAFHAEVPTYYFVRRINKLLNIELEHMCHFATTAEMKIRPAWLPLEVEGEIYQHYDSLRHQLYLFAHVEKAPQELTLFDVERSLNRILFIVGDRAFDSMERCLNRIDNPDPEAIDMCDPGGINDMLRLRHFCRNEIVEHQLLDFRPPEPEDKPTSDPMVDGIRIKTRKKVTPDETSHKKRNLRTFDDPMESLGQMLLCEVSDYLFDEQERTFAARRRLMEPYALKRDPMERKKIMSMKSMLY